MSLETQLKETMCEASATAEKATHDSGLPMIFMNGAWRVLAALPRKPGLVAKPAAEWLETKGIAIIPENRWSEYTTQLKPHVKYILDQGSVGSCAWEDTVQMMMVTMAVQKQPVVLLNPWTGYYQTNSRDTGSDTLENVQVANRTGVCPMAYWDREQHRWYNELPEGWQQVAQNYQVDEYLDIQTEMEIQTLIRLGIPCGLSNSSFWGGGHSTAIVGHRPNGDLEVCNSWGEDYGDGGYVWMPRRHVQQGFREGFSQVAVVSVKISGAYVQGAGANG